MRRVFFEIARRRGQPLRLAQRPGDADLIAEMIARGPCFLFVNNGRRPAVLEQQSNLVIIHMIRDPRDVLLSGLEYHLKHKPRPGSPEAAIHTPREDFDGLTYQERLRSLPSRSAKLRFEMRRRHSLTVKQMLAWDYDDPRHIEWRYEDMMEDHDQAAFNAALETAGYAKPDRAEMCRVFWERSLFGGADQPGGGSGSAHITSGKTRRWKTELPGEFAREYASVFGEALIKLGYETDESWLKTL